MSRAPACLTYTYYRHFLLLILDAVGGVFEIDCVAASSAPRVAHRLCLTIIPMGDHNAVDLAQAVHAQVLRNAGCMSDEELLEWGRPIPLGPIFEGLYIDDHVVAAIVDRSDMGGSEGRDRDLIDASHKAYIDHKLPRSAEKGFGFGRTEGSGPRKADSVFTAWGTRVRSEPGSASF